MQHLGPLLPQRLFLPLDNPQRHRSRLTAPPLRGPQQTRIRLFRKVNQQWNAGSFVLWHNAGESYHTIIAYQDFILLDTTIWAW